jgi:methylated-DNA-[protein]-cysteine S-methyltransferase
MKALLQKARIPTPIGALTAIVHDGALCVLAFPTERHDPLGRLEARFGPHRIERAADPLGVASRVAAYFEGDLRALDAIPVRTDGTDFQRGVWHALRRIPAGTTWSYARLADEVGAPSAVRAVGAANGRNPVPLVVPCHRVIASDGTLCGYGGGLDRKRWLLRHEGARFVPKSEQASLRFS